MNVVKSSNILKPQRAREGVTLHIQALDHSLHRVEMNRVKL